MVPELDFKNMEVGCKRQYLDSGSFSLWSQASDYAKKHPGKPWGFYDTKKFYAYMDAYAAFVHKYRIGIDYHSNVDVIGNPELTYRNQKYLEGGGLSPVPVVHYKSDLRWLTRYIEEGYDPIAIGGVVGSASKPACRDWIDRAFDIVCNQQSRLPKVRIHGFGVTTYDLMRRWPWWSVDSARWTKAGAYGMILVPHMRGDVFVYDEMPYMVFVSSQSDSRAGLPGQTFAGLGKAEKAIVLSWLEEIKIPFGEYNPDGTVKVQGVSTRHCERKAANLLFFELLRASLPKYPWAFHGPARGSGFGV